MLNSLRPTAEILSQPFDCVVIGGGINGSGIAREAAMRGLRVLLVEKNDLGSGTTAYSSRLIHGGLRYLETFEVDLVRESLRERGTLIRIAPHLIRPLPLGIPVYHASRRSLGVIQIGMLLYDLLSIDYQWPRHHLFQRQKFQAAFPGVNSEGLKGGAVYYDAQVNFPERLCVENAMAARDHGAVIWTHAEVTGFLRQGRDITGIQAKDTLTGQSYAVSAKAVINAAGPWVDRVLDLATPSHPPQMGPTKGTHIILPRHLPAQNFTFPDKALYVEAHQDGRPFFILPWLHDYMLIGTTDTRYTEDLDRIIPTEEEIQYLLTETNQVFPQAHLSREAVLLAYAGARPLPYAAAKTAGEVTRKHIIHDHGLKDGIPGLFSIIGGKITTYRNLAAETVTCLSRFLRRPLPKSTTQRVALPGGEGIQGINAYKARMVPKLSQQAGVSVKTVDHLIDLYGAKAPEVLALLTENPAWKEPLSPDAPDLQVQVIYAIRAEFAQTVEDVLMRRTGLVLQEGAGLGVAEPVAHLMALELGWDTARREQEMAQYREKVFTLNRPALNPTVSNRVEASPHF